VDDLTSLTKRLLVSPCKTKARKLVRFTSNRP
jgi:hypothetical protein